MEVVPLVARRWHMTGEERVRLTIEIPAEVSRRLGLAAARRDISIHDYVLWVLEERLAQDVPPALIAQADPVLAELWDNDKDAAYDRL